MGNNSVTQAMTRQVANTVTAGSGDSFAVYSLHINAEDGNAHFDCLCEFMVAYPVLSFVVCRDRCGGERVEEG